MDPKCSIFGIDIGLLEAEKAKAVGTPTLSTQGRVKVRDNSYGYTLCINSCNSQSDQPAIQKPDLYG